MMIDNGVLLLALVAGLLFWPFAAGHAAPNSARLDSLIDAPPPEKAPAVEAKDTKPPTKLHELHRLDFRIEGKSCPACLLGIQSKLKTFNGVQDAAVMVRRPYGASVIYKSDVSTSDYILALLKAKDGTVRIADVSDKKIDTIPVPLIPPFMPVIDPAKTNSSDVLKPMGGL